MDAWLTRLGLPCFRTEGTSVRSCLLALVVACLVPVGLGAMVVIVSGYVDGRRAETARAATVARTMMQAVDAELARATLGLQVLALSPALQTGDVNEFRREAMAALPYQSGNVLVLSEGNGQQLMNTLAPAGAALPLHNNPALLRRTLTEARPVVSDLFIGGVTKKPLVAVEVPVVVDGKPRYALSLGLFPDRVASIVARLRPEPEWVVSVFDSKGIIVARTHLPERFVGHPGAPALLEALSKSDTGVVDTDTLEGVPVVAAFTRSATSRWSVAVGVPRHLLLGRLQRWVSWLVVVMVGVLAFGAVLAGAIARRIRGSIAALIAPARSLGRGEVVRIGRLPLEEADAVASEMVTAAMLLRQRTVERDLASYRADHDPLTGLPNRARLLARMGELVAAESPFVVLFVDVDDFKPVNDRYGHAVGDELLRSFAARLSAAVRGSDLVARLGGDEFAVLMVGSHAPGHRIGQPLIEHLSEPYRIREHEVHVSACVGMAGFPGGGATAEAVLDAADQAMYRAKARGKRGIEGSDFAPL